MAFAQILNFEARAFLLLLGATVAYHLLTGRISTRNLLGRKIGVKAPSPERIQLLFATILLCFRYLSSLSHAPPGSLPSISPEWLAVFGGSSAIYAAGKAINTFWPRKNILEQTK